MMEAFIASICEKVEKDPDWSLYTAVATTINELNSTIEIDKIVNLYRSGKMVGQCPSFHDLKVIVDALKIQEGR